MKQLIFTLIFMLSANLLLAQTARIQVIHNSADMAADPVDIYINGDLALEDFAFRAATPFIDLPAGTPINIGVAAPNTSVEDTIKNFTFTLAEGETYIAIANGIVSESGYTPSPMFDIHVYAMGREAASQAGNTDVLVYHGSTDAPTVDVTTLGAGTIVDNISYSEYQGYLALPNADYKLQVRDETGAVVVARYAAPLATLGLADSALVVFASGFLNPANNSDGPAFGLYAALANGAVVALPTYDPMARIQVIHNSADMAADPVDIYVNGDLALEDVAFRSATPFFDAPAEVEVNIGVAAPNTSVEDTIKNFTFTLADGETYIAIANGIVSESGYTPSPMFDIHVYAMGREAASQTGNTDVLVYHGSTDAPTVDVTALGAGTIVDNISYSEYQGYLALPNADYKLQVRDETGAVVVARYAAPLATLGLADSALVVFASGFLNPANNSDGPAFGLYAALANGTVVALPTYDPMARIQVIHNSADLAADPVDVYIDGALALEDFAFRGATPFIDIAAETPVNIGVAAPNTMIDDTLKNFTFTLADGETYIAIANGIVSASGYSPSPMFDIHVYAMGREMASQAGNTDVLVYHGSTDAPTVDVAAVGAGTIVDNISYSEFQGYLDLPTDDYTLEVQDETGSVTVASYDAPLSTLGLEDSALVVFASGFLDPSNNSNGPAFGLYAALPNGTVVALPITTTAIFEQISLEVPKKYNLDQNYPNPFNPSTKIRFSLPKSDYVTLKIYDVNGRLVTTLLEGRQEAGQFEFTFDASRLSSGVYFYRLEAGSYSAVKQMMLVK